MGTWISLLGYAIRCFTLPGIGTLRPLRLVLMDISGIDLTIRGELWMRNWLIVRERSYRVFEAYCLRCQRNLGAGGFREAKLECVYHMKNGCVEHD